jgi:hypothetical protein
MATSEQGPAAFLAEQTGELSVVLGEADVVKASEAETVPNVLLAPAENVVGLPEAVDAEVVTAPIEPATNLIRRLGRSALNDVRNIGNSFRDIYTTARNEWRTDANLGARALLLCNVVGVLAEQGGLNETIIGNVGGRLYQHTHSVYDTAVGTGELSLGIQSILGLTTLISIRQLPKTMHKIGEYFGPNNGKKDVVTETSDTQVDPAESEHTTDQVTARHAKANAKIPISAADLAGLRPGNNGKHVAETHALGAGLTAIKQGARRFWDAFSFGTSIRGVLDEKTRTRRGFKGTVKNILNVEIDANLVALGVAAAVTGVTRMLIAGRNAGGGWEEASADVANFVTDAGVWIFYCGARLYSRFRKNISSKNLDERSELEPGAL